MFRSLDPAPAGLLTIGRDMTVHPTVTPRADAGADAGASHDHDTGTERDGNAHAVAWHQRNGFAVACSIF